MCRPYSMRCRRHLPAWVRQARLFLMQEGLFSFVTDQKPILKRAYSDASAVTSWTYNVLRSARRFGWRDENVHIRCVRNLRGSAEVGKSRQKTARTEDRSFDLEHFSPKADALPAGLQPVGLADRPTQIRPSLYPDALFKNRQNHTRAFDHLLPKDLRISMLQQYDSPLSMDFCSRLAISLREVPVYE
jgi:hypothetical protein